MSDVERTATPSRSAHGAGAERPGPQGQERER